MIGFSRILTQFGFESSKKTTSIKLDAGGTISKYQDLKITRTENEPDEIAFTNKSCKIGKYAAISGSMPYEVQCNILALRCEDTIVYDDIEYVVKSVSNKRNSQDVVAQANIDALKSTMYDQFQFESKTIGEVMQAMLPPGWDYEIIGDELKNKIRSGGVTAVNTLGIIQAVGTAFMCNFRLFTYAVGPDHPAKIVRFYADSTEHSGRLMVYSINLKNSSFKSTSYNFANRIRCIGKDGTDFGTVTLGAGDMPGNRSTYLIGNKTVEFLWDDDSYDDQETMQAAAREYLLQLSQPEESYSADYIKIMNDDGSVPDQFDFDIGDLVRIIPDPGDMFWSGCPDVRIKKIVEFPDHKDKNKVELGNRRMSFEDYQKKVSDSLRLMNAVVKPDGKIHVSDIIYRNKTT